MSPDQSAVGCYGEVIVATRGTDRPGEVLVRMRGATEAYLAWPEEPLPCHGRAAQRGDKAQAEAAQAGP